MTPAKIAAIHALVDAATSGEWRTLPCAAFASLLDEVDVLTLRAEKAERLAVLLLDTATSADFDAWEKLPSGWAEQIAEMRKEKP